MVAKVHAMALVALQGIVIEAEADIANGLPATVIVGLPNTAVQESRERVRSAIKNSQLQYPLGRIAVNLAPANVPKIGTQFDLALALAILLAAGQAKFNPTGKLFVGELSLSGQVRPVAGILAMVQSAKQAGIAEIYVPAACRMEASLVAGIKVYAIEKLTELLAHLQRQTLLEPEPVRDPLTEHKLINEVDFADIAGQAQAKRALEVALCGGHNLLMSGPAGSGKTLLAKAAAGILPQASKEELLELNTIYSVVGKLSSSFITSRPMRQPHHTSSRAALLGGGPVPLPGEITLAHQGILFLDEILEFSPAVLDALRQPLEAGQVTLVRVGHTMVFPAKFILLAACNPCPCGNLGDQSRPCSCAQFEIQRYQKRLSGPLLDRIDLRITVPRLSYNELSAGPAESSSQVRKRVELGRDRQARRLGLGRTNSTMSPSEQRAYCRLDSDSATVLRQAVDRYYLSGRAVAKILKVARTIADLQGEESLAANHIAEALRYRLADHSR